MVGVLTTHAHGGVPTLWHISSQIFMAFIQHALWSHLGPARHVAFHHSRAWEWREWRWHLALRVRGYSVSQILESQLDGQSLDDFTKVSVSTCKYYHTSQPESVQTMC